MATTLGHTLPLALLIRAHHVHKAWGHLTLHTSLLEHILEGIGVNLTAELLEERLHLAHVHLLQILTVSEQLRLVSQHLGCHSTDKCLLRVGMVITLVSMIAAACALVTPAVSSGTVVMLVLLLVVATLAGPAAMAVLFLVTALTLASIFVIALLIATTLALGLVSSLFALILMLRLIVRVVVRLRRSRRRLKSSRRGRVAASVDLLEVDWRRCRRGLLVRFLLLMGIIHDRGPVNGLACTFLGCGRARLALVGGFGC